MDESRRIIRGQREAEASIERANQQKAADVQRQRAEDVNFASQQVSLAIKQTELATKQTEFAFKQIVWAKRAFVAGIVAALVAVGGIVTQVLMTK